MDGKCCCIVSGVGWGGCLKKVVGPNHSLSRIVSYRFEWSYQELVDISNTPAGSVQHTQDHFQFEHQNSMPGQYVLGLSHKLHLAASSVLQRKAELSANTDKTG